LCNAAGSFVPISCLYEGNLEKTSLGSKLVVPAGEKDEDRELLEKYTLLMRKRMEIDWASVGKL
jgi:xylulokinase